MRKWIKSLGLVLVGLAAGATGSAVVKLPAETLVEEVPAYKILLVRDHGIAGRCGIELDKGGWEVIDPRKNEGPRWVRLQTADGYVCDWKMPDVLPDCVFNAHGPTMEDVSINCIYRFGDVNGDGDVDADDYAAVREHSGEVAEDANCGYDLNLDGRVNLIDAGMLQPLIQGD